MTDVQLYLVIFVPVICNALLLAIVAQMHPKPMDDRFDMLNQRFDDMRDFWRAELRRVEAVLDVRLKRIEEKRR